MVKAILFDFWGTLVENGVRSPVKQVKWILMLKDMDFSEYIIICSGINYPFFCCLIYSISKPRLPELIP